MVESPHGMTSRFLTGAARTRLHVRDVVGAILPAPPFGSRPNGIRINTPSFAAATE
jgi:hypothetical protein